MRDDLGSVVTKSDLAVPPPRGRGSGKEAWRELCAELVDKNASLVAVIKDQSVAIAEMKAEIALLRQQIAARKPKGGRAAIDDTTVQRIEIALTSGASTRQIAQRYKVSPMTVSRVKKRMDSRAALSA
jgi:DNA-binding NarL/FixJ family response regulator